MVLRRFWPILGPDIFAQNRQTINPPFRSPPPLRAPDTWPQPSQDPARTLPKDCERAKQAPNKDREPVRVGGVRVGVAILIFGVILVNIVTPQLVQNRPKHKV